MLYPLIGGKELRALEASLSGRALPSVDRIHNLDLLVSQYIYTRPDRATQLLEELRDLLNPEEDADYLLTYCLHLANLESQRYRVPQARAAIERATDLVEERGDVAQTIEVYLDYAGILINEDRMELASDYFDRANRLLESHPNPRLEARSLCRHGYLYLHFYSFPKAIVKLMEADRLLSSGTFELTLKDHYFYTIVQSGLGAAWGSSDGNREEASGPLRKAIDRCREYGLIGRLAWHQFNLGNHLLNSHSAAGEAAVYFRDVIAAEGNGSRRVLAASCISLATCYLHENHPEPEVLALLDRAETIYRDEQNVNVAEVTTISVIRAEMKIEQEDYIGAIRQLDRTLEIADVDNAEPSPALLRTVAETYYRLARCHASIEDYKSAYIHQLSYDWYQEAYQELADTQQKKELTLQLQADAREKEVERMRLKASQLQLRALTAQMNPHFLYNAMNSIQSFISTNNSEEASRYLAKFAMLMRQSLEYTSRETITLEEEIKFLRDYLEINCNLRFEGKLSYRIEIDDELEDDLVQIPSMLIQPYVENAIEHGLRGRERGSISIHFRPLSDPTILEAIITDNGVGRDKATELQRADTTRATHRSRGTEITQTRLDLLVEGDRRASTITEDLIDEGGRAAGTRVRVTIPTSDALGRRLLVA